MIDFASGRLNVKHFKRLVTIRIIAESNILFENPCIKYISYIEFKVSY